LHARGQEVQLDYRAIGETRRRDYFGIQLGPPAAKEPSRARREGRLPAAMTAVRWDEAPIGEPHDRAAFDCGDSDRDLYLQKFARQNHESGEQNQLRSRGA
jgi:hypothetical protein